MATILKFEGGARDGDEISTAADDPVEVQEAESSLWLLDGGEVGATLWGVSLREFARLSESERKKMRPSAYSVAS